ncbi:MAG: hypothetical protein N3A72_03375 [bacterium]|nr:hypothetical protein [bacterium]
MATKRLRTASKETKKQKPVESAQRPLTGKEKRHCVFLCILGWLVPGSGHWYLGLIKKGWLFFLLLNGLFLWGMWLKGEIAFPVLKLSSPEFNIVNIFVFIFGLGNGLMSLLELTPWFHVGNLAAVTYEVGTLYMVVSGSLNFFVVLDALDTYRAAIRNVQSAIQT